MHYKDNVMHESGEKYEFYHRQWQQIRLSSSECYISRYLLNIAASNELSFHYSGFIDDNQVHLTRLDVFGAIGWNKYILLIRLRVLDDGWNLFSLLTSKNHLRLRNILQLTANWYFSGFTMLRLLENEQLFIYLISIYFRRLFGWWIDSDINNENTLFIFRILTP